MQQYHSFFPTDSGDAAVNSSCSKVHTYILLDVPTSDLLTKQGNNHLDAMISFQALFLRGKFVTDFSSCRKCGLTKLVSTVVNLQPK